MPPKKEDSVISFILPKTVTQAAPIPKGIDTRGPRPQERVVTGTLTTALNEGAGSRSTGPIHAPRARVLAYIVNKLNNHHNG